MLPRHETEFPLNHLDRQGGQDEREEAADAERPAPATVHTTDNKPQSPAHSTVEEVQPSSWKETLLNPWFWLGVVLLGASIAVGAICGEKIFNQITEAKDWFVREVPLSITWYYIIFTVASIFLLPYGPFCVSVGFIFGFWIGMLIQTGAIWVSNQVLYWVGRYLIREKVEEHMKSYKVWKGLMKVMSDEWKEAAKMNLLLCFMPIPYASHAYIFSLTPVPFWQFAPVFIVDIVSRKLILQGMLPTTIINLLVGQALATASKNEGTNYLHLIGVTLIIVAIFASVYYASAVAQKILDEADEDDETRLLDEEAFPEDHCHRNNVPEIIRAPEIVVENVR